MKKYHSIPVSKLARTHYESADALAEHLANIIRSTGKACSLYTDYRWHTEGCVISPFAGYVTNLSLGYEGPFSERELLDALLRKGIYPNPVTGQSYVYVLHTKDIGQVRPMNLGCEPA